MHDQQKQIEYLEQRVEFLSKENDRARDALEKAAELGSFDTRLKQVNCKTEVLEKTAEKIFNLISLKAVAFYLVDEEDNSFKQAWCQPASYMDQIEKDKEVFVQEMTFAWSLQKSRPSTAYSKINQISYLLHPLATPSRIRGMFMGVLEKQDRDIPDFSYSLINMVLLACSNFLESFELYESLRKLHKHQQVLLEEKEKANQELQEKNLKLIEQIDEKSNLTAKLQVQNKYLDALHETSLGLLEQEVSDDLLQMILSKAAELVQVNEGFIFLYDDKHQDMYLHSSLGNLADHVGLRIHTAEGLPGNVFQKNEPLIIDDYQIWEGRRNYAFLKELRSAIAVPLRSYKNVIGVLGLLHFEKNNYFNFEHLRILLRIANLASITLHNAELKNSLKYELEEKKIAEEKLIKREEELKSFLENNPAGIILIEAEDRTVDWVNTKALEIIEADRKQVLGMPCKHFCGPEYDKCPILDLNEKHIEKELNINTLQGRCKTIHKSAVKFEFSGKKYLLEAFFDLTEQKKLEAQLRQASKMEAVGNLAEGIAHDFNNLLQGLSGNISLLPKRMDSRQDAEKYLQEMQSIIDKGKKLILRLLTFGRKTEFVPKSINLNDTIMKSIFLLQRTLPKMINIHLEADHALPHVAADPIQLEQILLNLATNASYAIGENNPEQWKIWIRTKKVVNKKTLVVQGVQISPGEYILLEFEDNGCGISKKQQEKMFEPFYTNKPIGKGTGLGLSIVYSVVKQHGGYLFCESILDKGTKFKIYLPVYDGKVQKEIDQDLSAEKKVRLLNSSKVQRVLLIDDEEMIRETLMESLQELDYEVYEAASGEEGLDFIKDNMEKIDLVVLDLGMPGMGGKRLLEELNKFEKEFKIIVASGYSSHNISKDPEAYGASAFLAKPYSTNKLLSLINRL